MPKKWVSKRDPDDLNRFRCLLYPFCGRSAFSIASGGVLFASSDQQIRAVAIDLRVSKTGERLLSLACNDGVLLLYGHHFEKAGVLWFRPPWNPAKLT